MGFGSARQQWLTSCVRRPLGHEMCAIEPAEPHRWSAHAWRTGEAGVEVAREDAARRLAHDEYPTRVGEFGQRGVEEDRARVVHGCRRAVLRGER